MVLLQPSTTSMSLGVQDRIWLGIILRRILTRPSHRTPGVFLILRWSVDVYPARLCGSIEQSLWQILCTHIHLQKSRSDAAYKCFIMLAKLVLFGGLLRKHCGPRMIRSRIARSQSLCHMHVYVRMDGWMGHRHIHIQCIYIYAHTHMYIYIYICVCNNTLFVSFLLILMS